MTSLSGSPSAVSTRAITASDNDVLGAIREFVAGWHVSVPRSRLGPQDPEALPRWRVGEAEPRDSSSQAGAWEPGLGFFFTAQKGSSHKSTPLMAAPVKA